MYLGLKLVHVLAAIVFVGNITVGVLWKAMADRTRDPAIAAYTMAGIIRADRVFTIPAIVVLIIAGVGTAQVGHLSILGTGWILWAIVLFVIAIGANALIGRMVSRSERGTVYGMTASATFLGNSLGPLTGGAIAASFGLRWVFLITSALLLINLIWVYLKVPEYEAR